MLGVAELSFLRQPDWFVNERLDDAADTLAVVLQRELPELIFVTHPGEPHPDHAAASTVVGKALAVAGLHPPVLGYEIWAPIASVDDLRDITPVMDRKLAAVRCYGSQVGHFRYDRAI